jgi:hypothetical protein
VPRPLAAARRYWRTQESVPHVKSGTYTKNYGLVPRGNKYLSGGAVTAFTRMLRSQKWVKPDKPLPQICHSRDVPPSDTRFQEAANSSDVPL